MSDSKTPQIEELSWDAIKDEVLALNPAFYKVINNISPSSDYTLFRCRYPYGSKIVKDGITHVPTKDGQLLPITDRAHSSRVRQLLGYSVVPIAIVLKNYSELFYENVDKVASLMLFPPGHIYGVWEAFDPPGSSYVRKMTTVTAGARSIFMLPKIMDVSSFAKLRKDFSLQTPMPKNLQDQWPMLAKMANHPDFSTPWFNDVLFFSKKWFDHNHEDVNWLRFKLFLYKYAWEDSQFVRNKLSLDVLWDNLSNVLIQKSIKVDPYLIETVKYLVAVGMGAAPGLRPCDASVDLAPIPELQQIFIEKYNLKTYYPTVMVPAHLVDDAATKAVYYSLQYPMAPISLPQQRNVSTIMSKLREIKELITYLQSELDLEQMSMYSHVKNVEYDFFHSELDNYSEIKQSAEIIKSDPAFTHTGNYGGGRKFAETAPFFRGCIRIKRNKIEHRDDDNY